MSHELLFLIIEIVLLGVGFIAGDLYGHQHAMNKMERTMMSLQDCIRMGAQIRFDTDKEDDTNE